MHSRITGIFKDLVLFMLNDFSVGGLFGQQFSSSTLQDTLHGAEAGADPWGEVEILPLHHPSYDRQIQTQRDSQ